MKSKSNSSDEDSDYYQNMPLKNMANKLRLGDSFFDPANTENADDYRMRKAREFIDQTKDLDNRGRYFRFSGRGDAHDYSKARKNNQLPNTAQEAKQLTLQLASDHATKNKKESNAGLSSHLLSLTKSPSALVGNSFNGANTDVKLRDNILNLADDIRIYGYALDGHGDPKYNRMYDPQLPEHTPGHREQEILFQESADMPELRHYPHQRIDNFLKGKINPNLRINPQQRTRIDQRGNLGNYLREQDSYIDDNELNTSNNPENKQQLRTIRDNNSYVDQLLRSLDGYTTQNPVQEIDLSGLQFNNNHPYTREEIDAMKPQRDRYLGNSEGARISGGNMGIPADYGGNQEVADEEHFSHGGSIKSRVSPRLIELLQLLSRH